MYPAKRQQLVERIWLLEQLRAEAKARAQHATDQARRARESAADAGQQAADLHDQTASLGNQLAGLHDELGERDEAERERAQSRAAPQEAEDERARPQTNSVSKADLPGAAAKTSYRRRRRLPIFGLRSRQEFSLVWVSRPSSSRAVSPQKDGKQDPDG